MTVFAPSILKTLVDSASKIVTTDPEIRSSIERVHSLGIDAPIGDIKIVRYIGERGVDRKRLTPKGPAVKAFDKWIRRVERTESESRSGSE